MADRLRWNLIGVQTPKPVAVQELSAGEVGFFVATIKNVADAKIGDTITHDANPSPDPATRL